MSSFIFYQTLNWHNSKKSLNLLIQFITKGKELDNKTCAIQETLALDGNNTTVFRQVQTFSAAIHSSSDLDQFIRSLNQLMDEEKPEIKNIDRWA